MEKNFVLNGNNKIAIFMDNWTDIGLEPAYFVKDGKGYELGELKFHESWDWLIPVVIKIQTTLVRPELHKAHFTRITALESTFEYLINIENTYKQVLVYINWYNKNS